MMAKKPNGDGFDVTIKVSPKGAVQINGLQRFPVTLYATQWEAIFTRVDAIRKFMADNKSKLSTKEDKIEREGGQRI